MAQTHVDAPEFHIVVRRPGRGPLAPYRFAITVIFVMAISGTQLWEAAHGTASVDSALIRAGIAGLFAWVVVGRANSILKDATPSTRMTVDTAHGDDAHA